MSALPARDGRRRRGPPVRIDTDRFYLESLAPDRAGELLEWLGTARIDAALVQAPKFRSVARASAYIASFDRVNDHILGIHLGETGRLVGIYTLKVDPVNLVGAVTVLIGDDAALRQYLARETARALVDWAFGDCGLEKITARVAESNRITSGWLGSRMTLEGHLRDHLRLPDGSRIGVLLYGLLKSDWPAIRERSVRGQQEWEAKRAVAAGG